MSNYSTSDLILKCEPETKVEVVMEPEMEEYEVPDGDDEESSLQFFNPYSNRVEEDYFEDQQHDNVDPLLLDDEAPRGSGDICGSYRVNGEAQQSVQRPYHSSSYGLRSSKAHQVKIHPYSLQIPRLYPPPKAPNPRKKRMHDAALEASSSSVEPKIITIEEVEDTVRTFIDNSLRSRKDPQCRHQFYHTIHKVLKEALIQNVVSPQEVDSYWIKYDGWASSSTSYRLGDHYMLQYKVRANDPEEDAPKIQRPSHKKGHRKKNLSGVNPERIARGMVRKMEESVKMFILSSTSRGVPLREDLHSRVEFYSTWHKLYIPRSELFLDFYWNALLNRTIDYYNTGPSTKLFIVPPSIPNPTPIILPPSPQKYKLSTLPAASSAVILSSSSLKNLTPSYPPPPKPVKITPKMNSTSSASTPKNLDMDRLVKICINQSIESGKDPKATHKFYWTIHRSLETVQSLNLSLTVMDDLWKKYDDWAELAYGQGQLFQLAKVHQLYDDVNELPPPAKRILPKARPPELDTLTYPYNLRSMLEKTVKGFIVAGNIKVNDLRDNLKQRRYFLESYVHFMQPEWEDAVLDHYWRRLLTETIYNNNNVGMSPGGGNSHYVKIAPRPMSPPLPPPPTVSPGSLNLQAPKKFDMDRLIQICINQCIESDQDPQTTHKFYWTIHRSMETITSLNLPPSETDLLWKKYDEWAREAFFTKTPFQIDISLNSEFFADVSELPPPPCNKSRPPRPSCLNKTNGMRKWLEKVVREFVIRRNSNVNTFREDLEERRNFLNSYVDFIPMGYETDYVIDGYWRRLLRETTKDYKLYMELANVVMERFNGEEEKLKEALTAVGSEADTKFNMDYLVKKVINEAVLSGVDPRSTHKFYWTIHQCLETSQKLNPSHKVTSHHLDLIWGQYDDMASKAMSQKFLYSFPAMETGKFYEDVGELPPSPPKERILANIISLMSPTRLFPSCPKSTAMKRFLDMKVKGIMSSPPQKSNWLRTRRKFFWEYVQFVDDMKDPGEVTKEFWSKLLKAEEDATSNLPSSARSTVRVPTEVDNIKIVPCYDIDD